MITSNPFVRWYYDWTGLNLASDPEGNLTKLCSDCHTFMGDHGQASRLQSAGTPADWEELPCDLCGRTSPAQDWTGKEALAVIKPD